MQAPKRCLVQTVRFFSTSTINLASTVSLSWGCASEGVLGLGGNIVIDQYEPVSVLGLPDDIVSVGTGFYHSFGVTSDGQLWSWGRDKEWQLGRPLAQDEYVFSSTPAPVVAGGLDRHAVATVTGSGVTSFAVTTDGLLYTFGASNRGQLGLGKYISKAREPRRVQLPGRVFQVSAGWGHACALLDDGRLFSWGWPHAGRLGHSFASCLSEEEEDCLKQRCIWEPKEVDLLQGVKVQAVACGLDHTLVMTQDGNLLSFGDNSLGQLGRSSRAQGEHLAPNDATTWLVHDTIAANSGKALKFRKIAAGLGHCLGIMSDGSVASWGWNTAGQCGVGKDASGDIVPVPTPIYGVANNLSALIVAGRAHSVLVTDDIRHDSETQPKAFGRSWPCLTMCHTWGSAANGRLGTGTYESSPFPELVPVLDGEAVVDVACGHDHTLVLKLT